MLYEATRVPYGRTRPRSYVVDLTLPDLRVLVEVKPDSRAENRNNSAKRLAAEAWCAANGWEYVIVTEVELAACGAELLSLEDAAGIPEVRLNERAKRALRRKETLRERRRKRKHAAGPAR